MIRIDRYNPTHAAVLAAAAIALSAAASWWGLDWLAAERHRLAAIEAMAQAGTRSPAPLIEDGMGFAGGDRRGAVARFKDRLSVATTGHRLLVERIEALPVSPDRPALLAADIIVSGSEQDIRRFLRIVEGSKPAIRFERWQIARTGAGEAAIRFEARAVALWEEGA